jgi:hypothetical protein
LDKCRAFLLGINGEYNFHPCGLSAFLWEFTGITPEYFKEFVGTGVSDEEVARWLEEHSSSLALYTTRGCHVLLLDLC